MQLKAGRPPVIEKERKCPECKKMLSKFNLGKYCFNHQQIGVAIEDKENLEKNRNSSLKNYNNKKLKSS